jgi:hypothetical protein
MTKLMGSQQKVQSTVLNLLVLTDALTFGAPSAVQLILSNTFALWALPIHRFVNYVRICVSEVEELNPTLLNI